MEHSSKSLPSCSNIDDEESAEVQSLADERGEVKFERGDEVLNSDEQEVVWLLSTKKFQNVGDVVEGIQCVSTKLQISLGDGVEVEVSDHVDEVKVYEVVDLELDLEERELDLDCVESIILWKTGDEVHVTSTNSICWNR